MSEEENITKNEAKNDSDSRIYEVGYLFVPTIPGEEVANLHGNLKDIVVSMGGEVISDEIPKSISLAYTMQKVISNVRNKFSTAYFGWVKFEMEPSKVLDLKKHFDLDVNIIRFLITKTIRENTMSTKKFMHRDSSYRKTPTTKKKDEEPAAPMNKEEVDKEIDAMVAV